jgi:hypothetical protein
VQATLNCTYNKVPQKKGPKGSRAKVITELRKSQEEAAASPKILDGTTPLSPLASPMFSRQPEPLPPDLVDACIAEFFDKIYTTIPILHRGWTHQKTSEISTSPDAYCVIGALCAFMFSQLQSTPTTLSSIAVGQQATGLSLRLVEDIRRMRNQTDYSENPTASTVLTSFFLSAGLFNLERYNMAWYYLQEAITFVKMMRINTEEAYGSGEPTDTMNRRIFWMLFVTERFVNFHSGNKKERVESK